MADTRELSVPLDIDSERLARIVGSMREPAILESGVGFGISGRWSFFAAEPRARFQSSAKKQPFESLDHFIRSNIGEFRSPADDDPNLPPFQGGLIGFFGYDLAPCLEKLPRKAAIDSQIPDLAFSLYDTVVSLDHQTGEKRLWAFDVLGLGGTECQSRLDRWRRILDSGGSSPRRSKLGSPIESEFDRSSYLNAVHRALEYIAAGDVFQVNLSQRFMALGTIEPLDLFLRLRRSSPAPFSAFLRWDDLAVISASPEWFYQTSGDTIVTRPIKGTRPRGPTPQEDAALAAELQNSVKDRAELTMIVDLERNDLGRVCEYGTVKVTEALAIESFAQVHHLVATIEGRLRLNVGPIDVVKALFPGGSITGAPKIRAMEIIDELEPTRRNLYTGAIGYFSRNGSSAFNIAIRTMLAEGNSVSYQVGGGIVADSDPENEYEETLHKGRGLRDVLEGRGGEE